MRVSSGACGGCSNLIGDVSATVVELCLVLSDLVVSRYDEGADCEEAVAVDTDDGTEVKPTAVRVWWRQSDDTPPDLVIPALDDSGREFLTVAT